MNDTNWWNLYGGTDSAWGDYDPAQMELPMGTQPPLPKIVCECGAHKTWGEKIPAEQHSFWCPLYKENK